MDKEEKQKTLLTINYKKLLAYLGGALVSFFTLFQITTEISNLHPVLVVVISGAAFVGIIIFTKASFKNYEEIIDLENKLGLSEEIEPSGFFSKRKNKDSPEREITFRLKFFGWAFIGVSLFMVLYSWYLGGVVDYIIERSVRYVEPIH